jgi:hypothetical protein
MKLGPHLHLHLEEMGFYIFFNHNFLIFLIFHSFFCGFEDGDASSAWCGLVPGGFVGVGGGAGAAAAVRAVGVGPAALLAALFCHQHHTRAIFIFIFSGE